MRSSDPVRRGRRALSRVTPAHDLEARPAGTRGGRAVPTGRRPHDATKGMAGMEIAVVYESMYGATREVADAIAAGVAEAEPDATVTCVRVGDADPDRVAAADLVIVGGPTHMRGM